MNLAPDQALLQDCGVPLPSLPASPVERPVDLLSSRSHLPRSRNCARSMSNTPQYNVPVLALLAPPALTTLHLTLRESDPGAHAVHACLCAAGTALRTLTLSFPWHLRIGQPSTPLPLPGLRTLRLLAEDFPKSPWSGTRASMSTPTLTSLAAHLLVCVLAPPQLEELRIDTNVLDSDGNEGFAAAQADLERVLRTFPTVKTVCIPM
jgi:hypothetical protein